MPKAILISLTSEEQRWPVAADRLLEPFQGSARVADKHFERLCRDWRQRLPKPGRLAVHAHFKDGRLRIGETRLAPSSVRLPVASSPLRKILRAVHLSIDERWIGQLSVVLLP
jgi:hypothetical protein